MDNEGHKYYQNGSSKHQVYWRCEYYSKRKGSCPGKAVTRGFHITQKTGGHLHEPGVPIIKAIHGNTKEAKLMKQMKLDLAKQQSQ